MPSQSTICPNNQTHWFVTAHLARNHQALSEEDDLYKPSSDALLPQCVKGTERLYGKTLLSILGIVPLNDYYYLWLFYGYINVSQVLLLCIFLLYMSASRGLAKAYWL